MDRIFTEDFHTFTEKMRQKTYLLCADAYIRNTFE